MVDWGSALGGCKINRVFKDRELAYAYSDRLKKNFKNSDSKASVYVEGWVVSTAGDLV